MSYISEIFTRLDIQQIREFLLYGVEANINVTNKSHIERIDEVSDPLFKMIEKKLSETEEDEVFINQVHACLSVYTQVYMEIGMICGANLVTQLLNIPTDT